MSELALDHDQRHPLAGHFDGVGVAELVRREASTHSCHGGDTPEFRACRGGRPMAPAGRPIDDAEQRSDR